jgi:hypothetical protein
MAGDAATRCLDVAEKIIGCLNDGEILRRYLAIKKRIYKSRRPQLSPHLKGVALEKRDLTHQLELLRTSRASATSLESRLSSELSILHRKVLPDSDVPAAPFESACESLLRVVEAKTESNNIIRQRLTDESAGLRDKISSLNAMVNDELKLSRQRILDADCRFRPTRTKIQQSVEACRGVVGRRAKERDRAAAEKARIARSISEARGVLREFWPKLKDAGVRKGVAELRLMDLRRRGEGLRAENDAKGREIESRRASQRFGVTDISDRDVAELRRLEGEVARLVQESENLALDIRKKRLVAANVDATEASLSGI